MTDEINLSWIAKIESSGNPKANSFRGASFGRGLHQISEIALRGYNQRHGTEHQPEDLYDPDLNTQIARWYFNRIAAAFRIWGVPINQMTLLAGYNWGMGNVYNWWRRLPTETRNYIKKYRELEKGDN